MHAIPEADALGRASLILKTLAFSYGNKQTQQLKFRHGD
jgi:hypothetical protein